MKKLKEILIMGLVLVLSLSACGKVDKKSVSGNGNQSEVEKDKESDEKEITKEEIVLRIVDWSDSSKASRDKFHEKFMEENPNVKIQYTLLTIDQFQNTIMTQIKSGDAPDLFPIPSGMRLSQAVAENWHIPLDDYLTEEFISTISPEVISEGHTKLDGKLYSLPENIGLPHGYIFYNKDLLSEVGLDPENPPKTWSEFRETAKNITEKGNGQFYGIIEGGKQLNRLDTLVRAFANVAGAQVDGLTDAILVDGKTGYNSPEMLASVGLLADLVSDGSFHPDTMSISAPEARAIFGLGQAAFLTQGLWCISTWREDNPDLNFGVMSVPIPDDGAKGAMPAGGIGPWLGISSDSKHPEMAAKYLMELYGEDYQGANVSDGTFVSIVPEINEKYMADEVMLQYYELNKETKLTPDIIMRDPKAIDFYTEVRDVEPSFGAIIQGVLAGSLDDYKTNLDQLNNGLVKEWERAAGVVGMDMSVLEFPNWDPTKPYTSDMYKELK